MCVCGGGGWGGGSGLLIKVNWSTGRTLARGSSISRAIVAAAVTTARVKDAIRHRISIIPVAADKAVTTTPSRAATKAVLTVCIRVKKKKHHLVLASPFQDFYTDKAVVVSNVATLPTRGHYNTSRHTTKLQ